MTDKNAEAVSSFIVNVLATSTFIGIMIGCGYLWQNLLKHYNSDFHWSTWWFVLAVMQTYKLRPVKS